MSTDFSQFATRTLTSGDFVVGYRPPGVPGAEGKFAVTAVGAALFVAADAAAGRTALALTAFAITVIGNDQNQAPRWGANANAAGYMYNDQGGSMRVKTIVLADIGQSSANTNEVPRWSGSAWVPASVPPGTRTIAFCSPLEGALPPSEFATIFDQDTNPCLEFEDVADDAVFFTKVMPLNSDLTNGVTVRIPWAGKTATSGDVVWEVAFDKLEDLQSSSFDTANTVTDTVAGSAGELVFSEITVPSSDLDGIAPGDVYRIRLRRLGSSGSDTMTGFAQMPGATIFLT